MNRQQRRAKARNDKKFLMEVAATSTERKQAMLFRNGITLDDLQDAHKDGWTQGKEDTEQFCFHVIYAAILITMCEKHGWDADDAADLLKEIDRQVVTCIEDQEIVDEAYEKTGIQLSWTDPLERVQEKEG